MTGLGDTRVVPGYDHIPAPTSGERARWAAQQAVHRVAGELADNQDIAVERRIAGLAIPMFDVAPEWGLRAALFLHASATRAIEDYAALARGQGASWARIGGLLELVTENHELPCGQAAFLFVVERRRPGQPPTGSPSRRRPAPSPGSPSRGWGAGATAPAGMTIVPRHARPGSPTDTARARPRVHRRGQRRQAVVGTVCLMCGTTSDHRGSSR